MKISHSDVRYVELRKTGPPREIYCFIFDECDKPAMLRHLGSLASNPDLSFSWYDAAKVGQRVRKGLGDDT